MVAGYAPWETPVTQIARLHHQLFENLRRSSMRRILLRPMLSLFAVALLLSAVGTTPAAALIRFDFEQPYFVHPGDGVRDFCVILSDSLYHIYYIHYPQDKLGSSAKQLGHAVSPDLRHWDILDSAILSGPDWWDAEDVWAPEVVYDDGSNRWAMLYTGVDSLKVQRACLAWSDDLYAWEKEAVSPVFEPDPALYWWDPTLEWSSFRDPFLFKNAGVWSMLSTAGQAAASDTNSRLGVIHLATSTNLVDWTEGGTVFTHDGSDGTPAWHDLESSQYFEIDGVHHLFFSEYDEVGSCHISATEFGTWSMSDRAVFDFGYAPEIDFFDPDVPVFSRYAMTLLPAFGFFQSVVRFDTLSFEPEHPTVQRAHPLDLNWPVRSGASGVGNPTFDDNPVQRGDPSVGLVGNSYFGSAEFYQGPLSQYGSPGAELGDSAEGNISSRVFTVEGDFIDFLISGGNYPQTCFIALVDSATDSILLSTTGNDDDLMTLHRWNVRPYQGMQVRIDIVDQEQGLGGHINIDEIIEISDPTTSIGVPSASGLKLIGAHPNPCNPSAVIRFELARAGNVRLEIFDMRGRRVFETEAPDLEAGPHDLRWQGRDSAGRTLPSGIYAYKLLLDGIPADAGRLTLVK